MAFTILRLALLFLPLVACDEYRPWEKKTRPWVPGDECPSSIKTLISSDPFERDRLPRIIGEPIYNNMNTLHTALLHCPNTTSLDLRVTGLGCSEWPSRWCFPFSPLGGETYPRLTSLRLEGYRFSHGCKDDWRLPLLQKSQDPFTGPAFEYFTMEMWRWIRTGQFITWLRWTTLPSEQRNKTNFALWLDAMDWSAIQHLSLDNFNQEAMEKLPSKLTSLTSLESTQLPFILQLQNNTLNNLTWIGPPGDSALPQILAHQGKSLQSLEFRCPELRCSSVFASVNVSAVSDAAPNVTHLSINVPRNGTWPLEFLHKVASMPNLRTADLWFRIQSECRNTVPESDAEWMDLELEFGRLYCQDDKFQKPLIDESSALGVFEYMVAKNEAGKLKHVTFWVGDWSRSWDGPLYDPPWAEGRRAKVACKAEAGGNSCVVERGKEYWNKGPWDDDDEEW